MIRTLPIIILFVVAIVAVMMTSERSTRRSETMVSATSVALAAANEPAAAHVEEPTVVEGVTIEAGVAAAGERKSATPAETEAAGDTGTAPKQDWVRIPGTPIGIWPKPTG